MLADRGEIPGRFGGDGGGDWVDGYLDWGGDWGDFAYVFDSSDFSLNFSDVNGLNAGISLLRGNYTQAAMYGTAAALSVFVPGGAAIAESRELAVEAAQLVKTSEGLASAAETAEASGSTALDMIRYPPSRGFAWGPDTITLPEGSLIDRYGYESGTFASPVNTPAEMRALAPGTVENKPYGIYRVTQAIDGVQAGPAMPWFNQPGFGMQYELPTNIQNLIRSGFLERIEQ